MTVLFCLGGAAHGYELSDVKNDAAVKGVVMFKVLCRLMKPWL
jgi:hypothetical protein